MCVHSARFLSDDTTAACEVFADRVYVCICVSMVHASRLEKPQPCVKYSQTVYMCVPVCTCAPMVHASRLRTQQRSMKYSQTVYMCVPVCTCAPTVHASRLETQQRYVKYSQTVHLCVLVLPRFTLLVWGQLSDV
ncbi:hypothetical protein NDU88_007441 [Pleurodeles waltl]|uniref:Uncharacterized protein n=1 Tax=Pleurodeles waltl TaxID=8319 RepID=A0AAV7LZW5_PLEWA|nr:hypothetical protein NDU88_007441 [Pleurodeles waltl]